MYHWVITLQWTDGPSTFTQTGSGTAPLAGKSRAEMYEQV